MYVPTHFEEHDVAAMREVIRARPFGTWVTIATGGLEVNHLPFLLHTERGEHGTLAGHVARANPVWRAIAEARPSVVVFNGANGYVTPSWYPSKQETGKAVPTWNYLVVHAHGVARAIDDREWLRTHVNELTDAHESHRTARWRTSDAPAPYIEALLGAIVGIEIPIERLEGKRKLSQNRSAHDLRGVIDGLIQTGEGEPEMVRMLFDELRAKQSSDP